MEIAMIINKITPLLADLKAHEGEAAAQAASLRGQDAAESPVFDAYKRAEATGDADMMDRALNAASLTLALSAAAPLDVSPLRWAAQHPDEFEALADLHEAQRGYRDRELAELARLRSEVAGLRAEAERMEQARAQAAHDLPDSLARLESRIRELEGKDRTD